MPTIRLAAAQVNPVVGDLKSNTERVLAVIEKASSAGCDLVAFPELVLTGYPPEDLLLKDAFVNDALGALEAVAAKTGEMAVVLGAVAPGGYHGLTLSEPADARPLLARRLAARPLANAAAVLAHGRVIDVVAKRLLPNYAVFDEQRWFLPGRGDSPIFTVAGVDVGVAVCEDLWSPVGPVRAMAARGASVIVSINASPFSLGQGGDRQGVLAERISETGSAILYVNQVGGQDELVFDGGSMILDGHGSLVASSPQFVEHLLLADLVLPASSTTNAPSETAITISSTSLATEPGEAGSVAEPLSEVAEAYEALVLGTGDYLRKNGFSDAVIGLSGGIDSTIVAVLAVDAIGAEHVHGVSMPSRYSSDHSRSDAEDLAMRLGISMATISIEEAHVAYASMLSGVLGKAPEGLTDENLQSRLRGVLLMAISNDTGAIVLTTGNKSEMATGYSTLYGDSAGGFAVIKDVPKTLVYELCRYRNAIAAARGEAPPIPEAVITKAPSAELRPDQLDVDSLPDYDELDPVLAAYVEADRTAPELIAEGHDPELVARVVRMVDLAEYKRRQMPPGVKITSKAFGKDRRMPITNRYRP